jgi:chorismate synthase
MSNTFGTAFKVTTFGESHCLSVGAVVDGCPPRLPLSEEDIQVQLDRRRPGQSDLTTARNEADRVTIQSGTDNGLTLGSPICLLVANRDQRPADYEQTRAAPRPSHADYTYMRKYGIHAGSGGGRASARETIGRVAAGAIAGKLLREAYAVEIVSWVSSVGAVDAPLPDLAAISRSEVDSHPVRCPQTGPADKMAAAIAEARDAGDSVGGIVTCVCRGVPAGWGDPVFDKMEAVLARAMLSIPAVKGFEVGSGFAASRMRGSEHNDRFVVEGERWGTATNNSGGIQGGISNGEPILLRVAFKPPATIALPQETVDYEGREVVLELGGRHDPCVAPRAVPVVEAMAALALADAALRQRANTVLD